MMFKNKNQELKNDDLELQPLENYKDEFETEIESEDLIPITKHETAHRHFEAEKLKD